MTDFQTPDDARDYLVERWRALPGRLRTATVLLLIAWLILLYGLLKPMRWILKTLWAYRRVDT